MRKAAAQKNELLSLANVGPATIQDFTVCGVNTIEDLRMQDPTELYDRLCHLTGSRHDPCVWDVFAAAIHEAKTGEKTKWWQWTEVRKSRNSGGPV